MVKLQDHLIECFFGSGMIKKMIRLALKFAPIVTLYSSCQNHGSGKWMKMGPWKMSLVSNRAIFHFHDYGRKSKIFSTDPEFWHKFFGIPKFRINYPQGEKWKNNDVGETTPFTQIWESKQVESTEARQTRCISPSHLFLQQTS